MPKEVNKKQNKEKKHFMKDFKAELKRVIWPTPKQLLNNTVAVITIVLIIAVIVFALDFAFEKMNEYGIEKLKSVVDTREVNETNTETDDQNSDTTNETDNTNATDTNEQDTNQVSDNSVNE